MHLREENRKLKQLVADISLDKVILKDSPRKRGLDQRSGAAGAAPMRLRELGTRPAEAVAETLSRLREERGVPPVVQCDSSSEFFSVMFDH